MCGMIGNNKEHITLYSHLLDIFTTKGTWSLSEVELRDESRRMQNFVCSHQEYRKDSAVTDGIDDMLHCMFKSANTQPYSASIYLLKGVFK